MKSLWYKIEAGSEWKQVQQIQSSERHGFNVKTQGTYRCKQNMLRSKLITKE